MPLILPANTLDSSFNIDNSLRFNDGDNNYLERTFDSGGSRRKFTISLWAKRSELSSGNQPLWAAAPSTGGQLSLTFDSNDKLILREYNTTDEEVLNLVTDRLFRDPSAWYHIVASVDTTQSTNTNRAKLYVNGELQTLGTATYPSEDYDLLMNSTTNTGKFFVGNQTYSSTSTVFDGYIAEFFFINDSQLAASSFAETDDNGVWIPKDVKDDLTFGTNGLYMEFKNVNPILGDAVGRHKISPSNGATFNTSVKKFGSSSLYLDNTNNYLDILGVNRGDFGFGACNSNSWTIEFWVYYLGNSSSGSDFIVHGDNNSFKVNWRPADPQFKVEVQDTEYAFGNNSPGLTDDTWTHIAIVNEGGTLKIYKDGTVDGTTHDISGKTVSSPNNMHIGYSDADTFDGYIDELRISNTARYTGNFSVATSIFDVDSNTKLLLHMDADHSIGTDSSGQGNHLTSYNFTLNDQTTDTPTNNFATLNPTNPTESNASFSEGNLKFINTLNSSPHHALATGSFAVANGKWYWEVKVDAVGGTAMSIGAIEVTEFAKNDFTGDNGVGYFNNGNFHYRGSEDTDPNTYTTGDIIGIALDMDNRAIYFHKNGTYEDSGDPTSGASRTGSAGGTLHASNVTMTPAVSNYNSGACNVNFGNPAFEIASSNSDANGYGSFEYSVPANYYSLCTKNLSEYG